MRQTIMLMAACAALLAGCTNEVGEGLGIDTPIQVTASVEGIMTTRADNTTDNLDNFGLSIKDGQSYTGNYAGENIKVTGNNTDGWTFSDNKTVLYKGSGQTYFAYAPHADAEDIDENMILSFSVQTDQSTGTNMQASDLLYDQGGTVGSANLSVTFSHKLSKLTVTLQKGENLTENVTFDGVTLRGTKPGTTLALVDDENGVKAGDLGQAEGTATDIKMCPTGTAGTYECILVPQTVKYSVVVVANVNNSPKSYVYTPANAYEFKSNNSYTLTLTIKEQDVQSEINSIKVAGWGDGNDIALGDGEAVEPYTVDAEGHYTVYTAEGLQAWADAVGESSLLSPVNCTLDADIDMTKESWTPIRTGLATQYNGVFDGNGHTIIGLGNCLLEENYGGEVRNLTLVNPTGLALPGSSFSAGAVAGINKGTIENCHVVGGSVKGDVYSGGIVGINMGTILACSSSATVTTDGYNSNRGGGIVGDNSGTILACYATGSVTASGGYIGAIAGENANNYGGTITACYWSGDAGKGVGEGSAEGVEEVAGGNWTAAMTDMNAVLEADESTYRWKTNEGDETGKRPLIITIE